MLFQLFFEDSVRNIQSGKRVGLDTVLVSTHDHFDKQRTNDWTSYKYI